jgi:hypothetical protein
MLVRSEKRCSTGPAAARVSIMRLEYHGWRDCYLMTNGTVDAVIIPAIGRVMHFGIAGEDGVFWENRLLDGEPAVTQGSEWKNFGGEKTWPAPQDDWKKVTGRSWPPPPAFDSVPAEVKVNGQEITLIFPVEPSYGIQTVRHITMSASEMALTITTQFRKLSGGPVKVGIWTVAQLRDPQRVFVLLPERSRFPKGFQRLMGPAPKDSESAGRLLSLRRHPGRNAKIATDGTSLLWVGKDTVLRMEAGTQAAAAVYTNMDPLPYVELETEGPLTTLRAGDQIEQTNRYTLMRRAMATAEEEAHRAFGLECAVAQAATARAR